MATTDPLIPNLVHKPATGTLGSSNLPTTLTTLGSEVLQILLLLGGIIAVFYLLYSGYRYISSNGEAEKTKAARAGIISTIVGVIIIALAFTLVHFGIGVGGFLGSGAGSEIAASDGTSTDTVNTPVTVPDPAAGGGTGTTTGSGTDPTLSTVGYPPSKSGYSTEVIALCTDYGITTQNSILHIKCYDIIVNYHDNYCSSVQIQAPLGGSTWCSGSSANNEVDIYSYCSTLLGYEAANGHVGAYPPCQNVVTNYEKKYKS